MTTNADDDIPFYLMPVAAVFGMYTCVGTIRILYVVYRQIFTNKEDSMTRLFQKSMVWLVSSVILSAVAYGRVVAWVENSMLQSEYALFDPYDILELPPDTTNTTLIKQAYRELSKLHHPDKNKSNASEARFYKINLAYRALTSDKDNWDAYGHPDGPVSTQTLSFALPEWLLHPQGSTAVAMVLLYLGMFGALIYGVVQWTKRAEETATEQELQQSVAGADAAYLASNLSPDSTHMDILYLIATTPESIQRSQQQIDKANALRAERLAKQQQKQQDSSTVSFDLDEAGWADDDDEDDKEQTQAETNLAKEKADRIARATGTQQVLLEGMDDGVLGQAWVEHALRTKQQWPIQNLGILQHKTFENEKKEVVGPLDHAAIRRNLCMTMGRLNATYLNTHPELLEAGSKKLIDGTYFSSTIEYRNRAGLLLEAALRIAMAVQSYRLAKTIVETVVMFKIGTKYHDDDPDILLEYAESMMKKYGVVPKISIQNVTVSTLDEEEIATGDVCTLQMEMERLFAEKFTKQKVAACQKQGIPPEIAMKSYQEGWWILVRAQRLDGKEEQQQNKLKDDNNPLSKLLSSSSADGQSVQDRFAQETGKDRLVTAWPLIVQNVAQKGGKLKVQFRAPDAAGTYRYHVAVKSQDFLAADVETTVDNVVVVDAASLVTRQTKDKNDNDEEASEEEQSDNDETKKEK